MRPSETAPISRSTSSTGSASRSRARPSSPRLTPSTGLRSLPHGHVEAVLTRIRTLALEDLVASEPARRRDLARARIAERLLFPSSKLANTRNWHDTQGQREL